MGKHHYNRKDIDRANNMYNSRNYASENICDTKTKHSSRSRYKTNSNTNIFSSKNIGAASGALCGAKTGHDVGRALTWFVIPNISLPAKCAVEIGCGIGGSIAGGHFGKKVGKGIDQIGRKLKKIGIRL